jgi:lambda family phage portal protein
MGFFDLFKRKKAKGSGSPRRNLRSFAGAEGGRLFGSWAASDSSGDVSIQYNVRTLRNRSRQLAEDNEWIKRFLSLLRINVVGPAGFAFQSKVKDQRVDGTYKMDTKANAYIEEAWRRWTGAKKFCSFARRFSLPQMVSLLITSVARDGEVFIVRMREGDRRNPFRLSLKCLEADYLDETHDLDLPDGRIIRMGIEQSAEGEILAYHFFRQHPGDRAGMAQLNERVRVPAEDVLHLFVPDRLSQSRGVPWLHASLRRTKMCYGYEEAELVAARAGASKMGFYVNQDGDGEGYGEDDGAGNFLEKFEPGTIGVAPKGYTFQDFDPKHPADAFDKFLKHNLRAIAASLNVAYPNLAADLEGTSYSSIRQGTLDERDYWETLQNWMIVEFFMPVFEWWLAAALMTQQVPLPMSKFDKFNAPQFRGRRWKWVDPQKDAKGDEIALLNGFTTLTQVVTDRGLDIEDVFAELEFEKERLTAIGVELPYLFPKQAAKAVEEPNAQETDQE